MNVGDIVIIVGSDHTGVDFLSDEFVGEVGTIIEILTNPIDVWTHWVDLGNGHLLWVFPDEIEPFNCE